MIDERQFECLLESMEKEIEDMPDGMAKSNMESVYHGLYGIFEDVVEVDIEKLHREHAFMKRLLQSNLSYEDLLYYKIKYNIDI